MFRLCGLLGLTLALGLVGILKAGELKRRQELLEEYMKLLLTLKSRINYFREPLSNSFMSADKDEKRKAFLMASDIFEELDKRERQVDELWNEKLTEYYKDSPLTAKDRECMAYVGGFIGQTDYENQSYQFEYTERLLQEQITQAGEAYRVKAPLYNKLGFFAGMLLAVILI